MPSYACWPGDRSSTVAGMAAAARRRWEKAEEHN